MLSSKDYDTLMQESLAALSGTNITQTGPGSKARALLEIINAKLAGAYQYLDQQLAHSFLATATGEYLDLLGDILACPRQEASYAHTEAGQENVRFYVRHGTFGDLNQGQDIIVPAGTIISTSDRDPNRQIQYRVREDTVLPAAANQAYVTVEAMLPGSLGTVNSRVLTVHNLRGYQTTLLVENTAAINNGKDRESDESYRWRLSRRVIAAAAANETAVRLACLGVPGVADVVIRPYAQGAGSFDIYVLPTAGEVTPSLLQAVQQAIDQQQALGIRGRARAPIPVGVQFQALIYLHRPVNDLEAAILQEQLLQRTLQYFSKFTIGQGLSLNHFASQLVNVSETIRTIGEHGKPFAQLYLWKPSRTGPGRRRYILEGDYQAYFNERLQLEIQPGLTAADFRLIA